MKSIPNVLGVCVALGFVACSPSALPPIVTSTPPAGPASTVASSVQLEDGRFPALYELNVGQLPAAVHAATTTRYGAVFLADDGLWLKTAAGAIVLRFDDDGAVAAIDADVTDLSRHRFRRDTHVEVPLARSVVAHNVWPGTDLALHSAHGQPEFDLRFDADVERAPPLLRRRRRRPGHARCPNTDDRLANADCVIEVAEVRTGCGCASVDAGGSAFGVALLALMRRRRDQRRR